jgi:hypothetical protein
VGGAITILVQTIFDVVTIIGLLGACHPCQILTELEDFLFYRFLITKGTFDNNRIFVTGLCSGTIPPRVWSKCWFEMPLEWNKEDVQRGAGRSRQRNEDAFKDFATVMMDGRWWDWTREQIYVLEYLIQFLSIPLLNRVTPTVPWINSHETAITHVYKHPGVGWGLPRVHIWY